MFTLRATGKGAEMRAEGWECASTFVRLSHLFDDLPPCSVCRAVPPVNNVGFRCRVSLDVLFGESRLRRWRTVAERRRSRVAVCSAVENRVRIMSNPILLVSLRVFAGLDGFEIKVHFVVHMWRARVVSDSHRSVGLSAHQLPSDSATEPPTNPRFQAQLGID